jgi:DNA topoisomerase III
MTDLILTEKFSVASDFAKALGVKKKGEGFFEGNGFVITWAVGHLVTLCEPEEYDPALKKWKLDTLPLIPASFEYKPIKRTYGQFKTIKTLLRQRSFERVIIATDAGREGEVIARTILLKAGFLDKARILRFWTSQALVPEVVRNTMEALKPMTDYDRLWRAGFYRQVSDWLIGMNFTRVLTVRLKDLFSVGRVQTAVLALLTDRKHERELFVPETYWTVNAVFKNDKGGWTGTWFKEKVTRLTQAKEAFALYQQLSQDGTPARVISVKKEKKEELPPLLFSLTDLQQEANKRFGFPAKKTLNLAQGLYQDKKCLSYPRTDSRVLGTQNLNMVQNIIKKLSGTYPDLFTGIEGQVSLSNKRVFNDAKLTDHHALIPFKALPGNGSADEKKLFDLVMRRFAAAFHGNCKFENTRVVTLLADETFQTRGRIILSPGWRQVYRENKPNKELGELIPPLVQGEVAIARKINLEEKQTTPLPEYTDALLLKDMTNPGRYVAEEAIKKFYRGDMGIGTQSTRAQIIETLITRKYIARSGKKLLACDKGCYLVEMLRRCPISSVLTSPEETARWEMDLNRISLGEKTNTQFLVNIKAFVTRAVNELKTAPFELKEFKTQTPALVGNCPGCGNGVKETQKAYSCSNKECQFVIWKKIAGKSLSAKMATNLLKYRRSGPFKGFISTKKKRFSASLVLVQKEGQWQVSFDFGPPGTRSAPPSNTQSTPQATKKPATMKPPIKPSGETSMKPVCPLCGGAIIEGKKGVGCANWRPEHGNCLFVIWKEILGKRLTQKNIETLLKGKTTRLYVFKDPMGNKFKAKLQMIQTPNLGFAIQILPEQASPGGMTSQIPCSR